MNEKYHNNGRYLLARLQRWALRTLLRPIVNWKPLGQTPASGYSVAIGCLASMPKVLQANLAFLAKQQRDSLHEIIVVVDNTRQHVGVDLEAQLRQQFPQLPIRVLYYTALQTRILKTINWGWAYAWLSWSKAIGAAQTQYVLLHDLDAMLLRNDILEERYQAIKSRGHQYVSMRYYQGNGLGPEDELVVTFELMFDAGWVRQRFHPVELFNHVGLHNGRRVEYDTFLHAQSQGGDVSILPIAASDMVHPSQLFCQYTEMIGKRHYVPAPRNNLAMLPYFFYLAGDTQTLNEQQQAYANATWPDVTFLGRAVDVRHQRVKHTKWIVEQITRLEHAIAGSVRPEVAAYLHSFETLIQSGHNAQDQQTSSDTAEQNVSAASPIAEAAKSAGS